MSPKETNFKQEHDLFRLELAHMVDPSHALVKLADQIDWEAFSSEFGELYVEGRGRPGVPIRLMVGLQYLKPTFTLSDERVVQRWVENPYWQYFCGEQYFSHRRPLHPSQMTRFRKRIGTEGGETLLRMTIQAGLSSKTIKAKSLQVVNVDTTVQDKAIDNNKLYSVHAPEVECIAKGKAHKKYEFGVKVSVASTSADNFVVGMQALPGRPYDGHTLKQAIEQVARLSGVLPKEAYVDRGYRGHKLGELSVWIAGAKRGVTAAIKKKLKRRNAVEPIIGHMKSDGRLARNFLKGAAGDAMNALLCGAGHNLRLILKRLALFCLRFLFLRLRFSYL